MGEIVCAYQPRYFPRLHYLARAQQADVFIIYDDVEFSRQTPQHRAPVRHEGADWLTIPVRHTGEHTLICEARVDMSTPWITTHLETLRGQYGINALELRPFYEALVPDVLNPKSLDDRDSTFGNTISKHQIAELIRRVKSNDKEWRQTKQTLDRLRQRKNDLSDRIATSKTANPDADISDLVDQSKEINERIDDVSERCREAKRTRDRAMVALSEHTDFDEDDDVLSLRARWELDGIDMNDFTNKPRLVELTVPLLNELFRRFDVTSQVVRSSELDVNHPGNPSEYLARLTAEFDGQYYLSGRRGYENYIEEDRFTDRDIEVIVQDWEPPHETGNVCSLDALFSAANPREYIR